jgi:uncharacterized membrane protein YeaQ/YmgE (transglycosylase-associated protein family)
MLLLGIILFGMLVGAGAQLLVGKQAKGVDWGRALVAGIVGSFLGGLIISLLSGDGLALRPSGILGSLAGAHTEKDVEAVAVPDPTGAAAAADGHPDGLRADASTASGAVDAVRAASSANAWASALDV